METNSSLAAPATFSVREFYHDKTLLVTGVTGFIGKVMLEKLLRECGQLRCIYALVRPRKGQSAQARIDQLFESPVLAAHQAKRGLVKAVSGDITAPGLGLSAADRQMLVEQVEAVVHNAATVVFTGQLGKFLDQNVYGTDSVMQLCRQMARLCSVVYVSTAFSNCHRTDIEERVVPVAPELGLEQFLAKLERHRDLSPQPGDPLLVGRPNPYTLSKAVAEWLIQERYGSVLPVIICRPSIVINAAHEPFPGWCDVKIGCTGALCLVGTGVAQAFLVDYRCRNGLIPVDLVANGLIVACAYRGSDLFTAERQVVHLTPSPDSQTWGQLFLEYARLTQDLPTMKQVRPLSFDLENRDQTVLDKIKWLRTTVSHYLFAYVFDLFCLVMGHRPFMVWLTQRLYASCEHLKFFSLRDWNFHYRHMKLIGSQLAPEERDRFPAYADELDWPRYVRHVYLGCRRFLIGDPESTVPQAKIRQFRLNLAFQVVATFAHLLLLAAARLCLSRLLDNDSGLWHAVQASLWLAFLLSTFRTFSKPPYHTEMPAK